MFIIRFFFALLFFVGVCATGYGIIQHYPSHPGSMTFTAIVGAVYYWLRYIWKYKRDRHRGNMRAWISAAQTFGYSIILMAVLGAALMVMMK